MQNNSDFMSRKSIDDYFAKHSSYLEEKAQALARRFTSLFSRNALAENAKIGGYMLLSDAYIEAVVHPCRADLDEQAFLSWVGGIMYHILATNTRR